MYFISKTVTVFKKHPAEVVAVANQQQFLFSNIFFLSLPWLICSDALTCFVSIFASLTVT